MVHGQSQGNFIYFPHPDPCSCTLHTMEVTENDGGTTLGRRMCFLVVLEAVPSPHCLDRLAVVTKAETVTHH